MPFTPSDHRFSEFPEHSQWHMLYHDSVGDVNFHGEADDMGEFDEHMDHENSSLSSASGQLPNRNAMGDMTLYSNGGYNDDRTVHDEDASTVASSVKVQSVCVAHKFFTDVPAPRRADGAPLLQCPPPAELEMAPSAPLCQATFRQAESTTDGVRHPHRENLAGHTELKCLKADTTKGVSFSARALIAFACFVRSKMFKFICWCQRR